MNAPVEPASHELLLRGVRVHFTQTGEGPALLLVHGFLMDHRAWRAVVPALATRFRVIVPDLPGFGASEKPSRYAYTREAFSETLCDLLAGLDVPRAHVAGHALGGAIALTLAADHPEYVDRLAVMDALAYPFVPPLKARMLRVPVLGPLLFKSVYGRTVFRSYFRDDVLNPGAAVDRATVDAWYEAFTPPDAREAAWRTLQNTLDVSPLGPKISRVRAPATVVWGERDRMFPLFLGQKLARDLGRCPLDVIPGASHAPAEDHADAVAELLTRHFLQGTDGRAPRALTATTP